MWFILDESLERLSLDSTAELAGLESLIDAASRGMHAVATKARTAEHLIGILDGINRKGYLKSIKQRAPQLLAELEASEVFVRITVDAAQLEKANHKEWHLHPNTLAHRNTPESFLLSENLSDCEAYEIAAKHFVALNRRSINVRVKHLNGGGAETPKVFKHEIEKKDGLTLCITDTDRRSPNCAINSTSSQCSTLEANAGWIVRHLTTEGREAENIIPSNLLLDTVVEEGQEPTKSNTMALLSCFENDLNGWFFLDLKNGTPLGKKGSHSYHFWQQRLHYKCSAICENFDEEAAACNYEPCRCNIAPPICERVLEKFNGYARRNSVHATAERAKTSRNNQHWLRIGALVASWGAANRPMRS